MKHLYGEKNEYCVQSLHVKSVGVTPENTTRVDIISKFKMSQKYPEVKLGTVDQQAPETFPYYMKIEMSGITSHQRDQADQLKFNAIKLISSNFYIFQTPIKLAILP